MKIDKLQNQSDNLSVAHVKVQFDKHEISVQNTPFGVRLMMREGFPAGELGSPAFPAKIIRVVIAPFTDAERIDVKIEKTVVLKEGPVLVAPLQKPQPGAKAQKPEGENDKILHFKADEQEQVMLERHRKCDSKRIDDMEKKFDAVEPFPVPELHLPNTELYAKAFKSPDDVVRIIKTEHAGPNSVLILEVKPIRYTKDGGIELCTDIDVAIYSRAAQKMESTHTKALLRNATQANRIMDELKATVINPVDIIDWGSLLPYFFKYNYVVITDNYSWNAMTMTRGAFIGDQVAHYNRLADWKEKRGITSIVITITDIVGGRYGNHTSGARDLQEVIRNFLKWALAQWNTSWVLLGGDVNVVPVRNAPGASEGHIGVQTANNPPDNNQSFWTGAFLKMNVVNPGTWWPGNWAPLLVNATTGALIPLDTAGTSSGTTPGWFYCTDNTYATRTTTRTQFVRVNGPAALVNTTLQWLYEWNTIPTDFYYSSLVGPNYDVAGRHDWDLLDNGIYGQHTNDADMDGINYFPDVSVGRAPTSSAEQARVFVNKVIAYEQLRDPAGNALDTTWLHRMALVSSNWGGRWGIYNSAAFPPPDFNFNHPAGQAHTIIKLPSTDFALNFNYNLLAVISDTDVRTMPYNDTGGRGWYYCKGPADLTPSGIAFDFFFFHYFFPIPSPWIAVRGAAAELTPSYFILDHGDADGSMQDQETLRKQVDTELPLLTEFSRLYEDLVDLNPADLGAAPAEVLSTTALQNAINRKQHFVSLSGHGNSGGCCGYSSAVVAASNNGSHTYIAFADSCLTNQFDDNDAVSEHSLFHPDGGAVAYIGNSRFSWIGVGDNFQRAFFHRMTTTRHLGHLNDTRVSMVDEGTGFWRLYNKWVVYAQNLMGDPEMPVWTRTPLIMIPSIPTEWDVRKPLPIHTDHRVIFIRLPLPGVFAHIQQGTLQRTGTTNAAGDVTLSITGFTSGPAELTLSKIGYKPVIATINILVPAWVKGPIKFIRHQEASDTTTEIGLQIGNGTTATVRVYRATKSLPDYGIILDAATDAFVTGREISFFVNADREHGLIEKFRFEAGVA
ncbi:C25 family cysteine peptidase [Chryseolinea lacunae]|uniref:Gingipain domain-containing protein n=1 Tax=Chryseolinea lacunae TaxID=2801331 RepID=A0ABS1KW88_9BACT|nr:C25 family cysteine peptidase [Chryseolinea lacunae]MBL0743679.1 hypothetical protein [Chryseolinea lacunae]